MKERLIVLAIALFAMVLTGAVANTGGRDVPSAATDYTIKWSQSRMRDISIYPLVADITVIFASNDTGVNDTLTVPSGIQFNATLSLSQMHVFRAGGATRVVHTWVNH